jgi:hemolysin D
MSNTTRWQRLKVALAGGTSALLDKPALAGIGRHWDIARESLSLEKERAKNALQLRETAFLPAALEILETPPSPLGRIILWAMTGFLLIALGWSILGKVDEVAVAPGKLAPRGEVKVIQAADYGVVRAIHVVDGQEVHKGQPLIVLDPTVSHAEAEQARRSLLVAQTDRTRAMALSNSDKESVDKFTPPKGVDAEVAKTQKDLVEAKVREHQAAHNVLLHQIAEHKGDLGMVEAEVAKLQAQLPLAESQYQALKHLAEQGAAPRIQMMEMEERAIGIRHDLMIRQSEALKMQALVRDGDAQLAKLDGEFKREALDSLNEAQAAVSMRGQELIKAEEKSALTILKAPVDGVIQQLAVHTVGAVVKPADTLLVVVPRGAELTVEAMVLNRDAGFVHKGQPVEVKLEAYPFTRYGVVPAVLETISRDAIEDKEKGLVYMSRARLLQDYILIDGERSMLAPGLSATAEIKTGDRRIISYLLSPLARRVKEAGRER